MKIQVWFCELCDQEFAVSDIPRDTVRCTGGHPVPNREMLTLTPDHWPTEARMLRIEGVTLPPAKPEEWGTLVLKEGERFSLEDAKKAPDEAAERSRRLTQYGWPEGMG
jgi:hypothetical protein